MRKFLIVVVAVLSCMFATVVMAQEAATPYEVVTKVREAAHNLSKTHDLKQFDQGQSSRVWKDTYVFVFNCETKTVAAHPVNPKAIGRKISSIRDATGNRLFPDVDRLCREARTPSGIWIQYRWRKPGEKKDSRKVSYFKAAKGTTYIVGAGIYDEKQTAAELQELTEKNKE
jgi:cytochrome c